MALREPSNKRKGRATAGTRNKSATNSLVSLASAFRSAPQSCCSERDAVRVTGRIAAGSPETCGSKGPFC